MRQTVRTAILTSVLAIGGSMTVGTQAAEAQTFGGYYRSGYGSYPGTTGYGLGYGAGYGGYTAPWVSTSVYSGYGGYGGLGNRFGFVGPGRGYGGYGYRHHHRHHHQCGCRY